MSTNKRPLSVLIIGSLFVVAGIVGVAYHSTELKAGALLDVEVLGVLLVRIIAIVGGVFALRGANWARWVLVIWMGYHVVLSAFHSVGELAMHAVLLGVITFFLFRPDSTRYFHAEKINTQPESHK